MLQRLLVLSSRYKTLKSNFKSNFNAIEVLQVQLGRPKNNYKCWSADIVFGVKVYFVILVVHLKSIYAVYVSGAGCSNVG